MLKPPGAWYSRHFQVICGEASQYTSTGKVKPYIEPNLESYLLEGDYSQQFVTFWTFPCLLHLWPAFFQSQYMFIVVCLRVHSFTDVVPVWCDWLLSCKSYLHRPFSTENHEDNCHQIDADFYECFQSPELFIFRLETWFEVSRIPTTYTVGNIQLTPETANEYILSFNMFVCWLTHN